VVTNGDCTGTENLAQLGRLRNAMNAVTSRARNEQAPLAQGDLDVLLEELGAANYVYSSGVFGDGTVMAGGTRRDLMQPRWRIGKAFHDLVSSQDRDMVRFGMRPAGAIFLDQWLTYTPPSHALTFQYSRARGITVTLEKPLRSLTWEVRREGETAKYQRHEVRLGLGLSSLGIVDTDQLDHDDLRIRYFGANLYADWVTDGFGFLHHLGTFVRPRIGLGISGSLLQDPGEIVAQLPELRIGFDIAEAIGLRVTIPMFVVRARDGDPLYAKTPKYWRETGLGISANFTWW
jgi:hypothetical protein